MKTGDYQRLTDSKYLILDKHLRRGDILVNEGSHTVMVLYAGAQGAVVQQKTAALQVPILLMGDKSDAVKVVQQLLLAKEYNLPKYGADGSFGEETKNALQLFQKDFGIDPDGQCGEKTWFALLGLTGVG